MTYKTGGMADAGVAIIVGLLIGLFAAAVVPTSAQQQSDKYDADCTGLETAGRCADKPFSHEHCQYPDRWTNPADGCDNSDPAVPECIKAFSTEQGEKDCIAAFISAQTNNNPVTTASPSNSAKCEGK